MTNTGTGQPIVHSSSASKRVSPSRGIDGIRLEVSMCFRIPLPLPGKPWCKSLIFQAPTNKCMRVGLWEIRAIRSTLQGEKGKPKQSPRPQCTRWGHLAADVRSSRLPTVGFCTSAKPPQTAWRLQVSRPGVASHPKQAEKHMKWSVLLHKCTNHAASHPSEPACVVSPTQK